MNRTIRPAAAALITAAALAIAGCASTSVHKAAATPAAPATTQAPVTDTPVPEPSDSTTDLTGAIGTSFTVTADDGTSYDVTLDKVIQHVRLGQYDTLDNYKDHAAAAQFTITGDTGQSTDDAFSDANAIGSDQTQYESTFITDSLPGFSSGEFRVAPGQTVKGWVTFELPPGVTIAQVQWAPGFNSQAATWTVSS
jgi:hypothetical protein